MQNILKSEWKLTRSILFLSIVFYILNSQSYSSTVSQNIAEESNLTYALDHLKTLHLSNCHNYLKTVIQGSLCYYERKQWIKSMIMLIKSAIYTETVIEWCLHNTFSHTYSHSCMNPEIPFFNYSSLFVHTVPIYSVSHHLRDLRKEPHVILIQLNHYKQRYSNLCCRKQIWLLLASAFQTRDIHCRCLINSYVVEFYEPEIITIKLQCIQCF